MLREKLLIDRLKIVLSNSENICYFGIDLITENYDPNRLAELAKREGLAQRLGYLAEICARAAEVTHISEKDKLTILYKALEGSFEEWQLLTPKFGWSEDGIRRRMRDGDLDRLRREKWKIYSALEPEEIEDWIDLYVTKDYLHFTPWERYELDKKGVKYTRLLRRENAATGKSVY